MFGDFEMFLKVVSYAHKGYSNIVKYYNIFFFPFKYILKCYLFLWWQNWIFRNHSEMIDMLIWTKHLLISSVLKKNTWSVKENN